MPFPAEEDANSPTRSQLKKPAIPPYSPIPDDEIPVLVTIFNRPEKTEKVMERLRQIKPKRLFISADGPRPGCPGDIEKCEAAQWIATMVDWPCTVEKRFLDANIGVDPGVRTAIDWFFQNVEYGIMLEDDCLVHPHFFAFCGELLPRYADDERIMQISSLSPYEPRQYPYDYHFSRMFRCSGGWATWRRAWKHFTCDMDQYGDEEAFAIMRSRYRDYTKCLVQHKTLIEFKRGSLNHWVHWDFQWNLACYAQNGLAIVPEKNLMINIGFDEEGTHTTQTNPIFDHLQTEALRFPLRQPPFVYPDAEPERSLEKKIYRSLRLKSRMAYLLRHVRAVIAYIYETLPYGEYPVTARQWRTNRRRLSPAPVHAIENACGSGAGIEITFGMIVFNGEPFVTYSLSAVYPFAHQIIVVEGACLSSASIAGPDGHSTDGTLESLRRFKRERDPENKLIIVTATDEGYADGFWPEKDEMSMAYAKRATGNYLWQIDADEFYHEEQMTRVMHILRSERPDMVSFPMITFWGSPQYMVDSFYLIRDRGNQIPRLFAWAPGYTYATHRPATVLDEWGRDLRKKHWLQARDLQRMGIYMYHYSLLFPHQVLDKVTYYKNRLNNSIDTWEESVYLRLEKPFRVHNVYRQIGWLERFSGEHPAAIRAMMAQIKTQAINVRLRDCADVERLLAKRCYNLATALLRACAETMAVQPFRFFHRCHAAIMRRVNTRLGKSLPIML